MDRAVREAAALLWQFHAVDDPLRPADLIVGLGSYDLRVAARAAELHLAGLAPRLLFTGAAGNWTRGLFAGSEAEAFADHARSLGVPPDAILLETTATNLGENIRCAASMLPAARAAIFVTKPQTLRRCRATLGRQWPGVQAMVTAPRTAYADQPLAHHDARALICEMVGDLERLRTYPALGFQAEVEIPDAVLAAFRLLCAAGYTDHLPG